MVTELWRRLTLRLGLGAGEENVQTETRVTVGTSAMRVAPALEWDSALPGMTGRVAVPAGPGKMLAVRLAAVTVNSLFEALVQLTEGRTQWPYAPEAYQGWVALEGPGWTLTALATDEAERVEYHLTRCSAGAAISGRADWRVVAVALTLAPEYEAVAEYLALSPYQTMQAYYVA